MPAVRIKHINNLRLSDYQSIYTAMQVFTQKRDVDTIDELWCVQHSPVYTQGRAGKPEHILERTLTANDTTAIPIIETDRGGQVTYHGPGQIVIYPLCNLNSLKHGVQNFVSLIEQAMVDYLQTLNIRATGNSEARGVYIGNHKIGSIGLRIKKDYSYHGLSLNYEMDTKPFSSINPCGYSDLKIAQVSDFVEPTKLDITTAFNQLAHILAQSLGYDDIITPYEKPDITHG